MSLRGIEENTTPSLLWLFHESMGLKLHFSVSCAFFALSLNKKLKTARKHEKMDKKRSVSDFLRRDVFALFQTE